jgi:F-box interacting protein
MMVLECVTWVPHFLYELQLIFSSPSLLDAPLAPNIPDDVIVNILSRLPAEYVMQCRRVCKKWRALTSSPYFVELHIKRGAMATPFSLFMNWRDRYNCCTPKNLKFLNFLYEDHGKGEILRKVRSQKFWNEMAKFEPTLLGSCDGLLLFVARYIDACPSSRDYKAFVLNPVTQELVVLHFPFPIEGTNGIYRDPSTHEYKVVFTDSWCHSISFYIYSLKSMQYKWIMHTEDYVVHVNNPCAISMNGSLHWLVSPTKLGKHDCKLILTFNTECEEVDFHPHPGSSKSYCSEGHGHMHIVGTNENLWFFNVLSEEKIDVWVLRDYDSWTWEVRNSVKLLWSLRNFPYPPNCRDPYLYEIRVVAIRNNVEVLICWSDRGMFWYNLENHNASRASVLKDKASTCHDNFLLHCAPYVKTFARINPAVGE